MQTRSKTSCCIDRRAVEKGSRPPVCSSAGIEKLATELNPSVVLTDILAEKNASHKDPLPLPPSKQKPKQSKNKIKRTPWTREEKKNLMLAYYFAKHNPQTETMYIETYNNWRKFYPDSRMYLDAVKLDNMRRYIQGGKNRLSDKELHELETLAKQKIENSVPIDGSLPLRTDPGKEREEQYTTDKEREQERNDNEKIAEKDNGSQANQNKNEDTIKDEEREEYEELKLEICNKFLELSEETVEERKPLPKLAKSCKIKKLLRFSNKIIEELITNLDEETSLTEINRLHYAVAAVISERLGPKPKPLRKKQEPKWKVKIKKEIERMRREVGLLKEVTAEKSGISLRKKRKIIRKYRLKKEEDIVSAQERLKQKIQAKALRLNRFDKRSKQYRQNKLFREDQKRFYRELGKTSIKVEEPPAKEEIKAFWNAIWSSETKHNESAEWIKKEEELHHDVKEQEWLEITPEEVTSAISDTHNWKAPGVDKVHNYWLKKLTSLHGLITVEYNKITENPSLSPHWLTNGITYLQPKSSETNNPKNYRPITCLPTTYKILTSILSERTYKHLLNNDLFPSEQKGCKKNSYGCKDQLLINKMILQNCKNQKRSLSTAWIDYRKAFDSVPHSWILKSMELTKLSPTLINFMKLTMSNWKTDLYLKHSDGTIVVDGIDIKCGIFQGDSFSPLLFCIALFPLSNLLNSNNCGYKIYDETISHLFFMDDLKLYTKNDDHLETQLNVVKMFSDDICMSFGLDKCAKASFKRGKLKYSPPVKLDLKSEIKSLESDQCYKYLGVLEGDGISHSKMKEILRKEYQRRVRMVCKSELNSRNCINAINALAVPLLTYSFNIVNWTMNDIRGLDVKTRKIMHCNSMHHPKAEVNRLYLPRIEGGRGLLQLEASFRIATIGLATYLLETNDNLLKQVCRHEKSKRKYSVINDADSFKELANLENIACKDGSDDTPTAKAKSIKQQAKKNITKQMHRSWENKPMHGQYSKRLCKGDTDKEATNLWLKSSTLKSHTEGLIIAAQDQSLPTNQYKKNILHQNVDPKCRLCNTHVETIDHVVSGCPVSAKTEYLHRHNMAAAYIHWCLSKHYGFKTEDPYYKHEPKPVLDNDKVTILWDYSVQTDKEIKANRPDIIVRVKKKGERHCYIIDFASPSDNNVSVKTVEKLSKYKSLEIEIQKMWETKTTVIPIVIGSLGLINKNIYSFLDKLPCKIQLSEIQKTVLLGTAYILRKHLSI